MYVYAYVPTYVNIHKRPRIEHCAFFTYRHCSRMCTAITREISNFVPPQRRKCTGVYTPTPTSLLLRRGRVVLRDDQSGKLYSLFDDRLGSSWTSEWITVQNMVPRERERGGAGGGGVDEVTAWTRHPLEISRRSYKLRRQRMKKKKT